MFFHIITLFPNAFKSYLGESILKRAIEDGKIFTRLYNPRDFTKDKHKRIDRAPYGGGPGMVIQAEPVIKAIEDVVRKSRIKKKGRKGKILVVWLVPAGKQFTNEIAKKTAQKYTDIVFICGRYEGIDARVKTAIKKAFKIKIDEMSVGPYVLTGGELPTMIMIDAISRQIPGVLGDINSLEESRTASPDVYTRPESFKYKNKTYKVPKILLTGNHAKIEEWKRGKRGKK